MKQSTKQSLGIILVIAGASLAMQLPSALAETSSVPSQIDSTPRPTKVYEIQDLPFESPSPEPSVGSSPTVGPTFIPPRTLPPDPQNPGYGAGIGGSIAKKPTRSPG